jgi:glucosamine kinase
VKLIAESGSTKTIWVAINKEGAELWRSSTIGLNPFFVDSLEVSTVFSEMLEDVTEKDFESIQFYGASCSSPERNDRIRKGLRQVLPNVNVSVDHDLLAAARAGCGTAPGIVAILGTGSNSCEFNGSEIIDNIPSMGFIVGDEGSGSSIGRRLVRAWVYREMPQDLSDGFSGHYGITKESVLVSLYDKEKPNRFLASLSQFCSMHRNHLLIQEILAESFKEFIVRHLLKYETCKQVPIHFVGSIAHHYRVELKTQLEHQRLMLGKIIQSPIDELVNYHRLHGI